MTKIAELSLPAQGYPTLEDALEAADARALNYRRQATIAHIDKDDVRTARRLMNLARSVERAVRIVTATEAWGADNFPNWTVMVGPSQAKEIAALMPGGVKMVKVMGLLDQLLDGRGRAPNIHRYRIGRELEPVLYLILTKEDFVDSGYNWSGFEPIAIDIGGPLAYEASIIDNGEIAFICRYEFRPQNVRWADED